MVDGCCVNVWAFWEHVNGFCEERCSFFLRIPFVVLFRFLAGGGR